MVDIQALGKRYGDKVILDDVSFHVGKGEIYGLIGVSGAGKSTLLRCINALETYDSGSLTVDGHEAGSMRGGELREYRRKIGMIFQDFALLERKTALENVMLPLDCWGYGRKEQRKTAEDLLDMVGLADKCASLPRALSGGQKQRVAIARTLAMEPSLLLCDEATSALDPMTTEAILQLLLEIQQRLGITVIIVTHQLEVVKKVCTRMSILEHGRVAVTGDVAEIFTTRPKALENLTVPNRIEVPHGHAGFKISLGAQHENSDLFTALPLREGITYQVLFAETDVCAAGNISHFYLAVPEADTERTAQYLTARHLLFQKIGGKPV